MRRGLRRGVGSLAALVVAVVAVSLAASGSLERREPPRVAGADALGPVSAGIDAKSLPPPKLDRATDRISDLRLAKHRWPVVAVLVAAALSLAIELAWRSVRLGVASVYERSAVGSPVQRAPPPSPRLAMS